MYSSRYRSAEDIPRIITQGANYGWRIPGERYYLPSEAATSETIIVYGNIPIEMVKEITRVTSLQKTLDDYKNIRPFLINLPMFEELL